MPRTSKLPKDIARRTELAKHKEKIRRQKEEIVKLQMSIKARDRVITGLNAANAYLTKTAKAETIE